MDVKYVTAKAKVWANEPSKVNRFSVDEVGVVRVWDDIGNHYTRMHDMSERTIARIRKMAETR